jgi:uncharacterized membrane protein YoaK (UPF0700 family)
VIYIWLVGAIGGGFLFGISPQAHNPDLWFKIALVIMVYSWVRFHQEVLKRDERKQQRQHG